MPAPTQDQLNATYSNDDALGLPRGMTAKQIGAESSFNPDAVSPAGAMGYAQVMPKTLATLSERAGRQLNPSNFDDSLLIHREVMGENIRHFGNIPDALRAYNDGWDKTKWNNPETVKYVAKITGQATDPITKKLSLSRGGSNFVQALVDAQAGDRTELDRTQQSRDMRLVAAGVVEAGQDMADRTHYAGAWESFTSASQWSTVTGRIADLFRQEQPEAGYEITSEQKQIMADQTPEVFRNDDLRDYVFGATSNKEWSRRMGWAIERADYLQRASNTQGIQAWANGTVSLAAGMGDPATLMATMGTGAVVNAARGAFVTAEGVQAARAASAGIRGYAEAAAAGAAGNMAVDAAVRKLGNNEIQWPEMFQQGIVGAALGGMGHYVGNRFGNQNAAMGTAVAGAEATDHALIQRTLDEAGAQPVGNRGPGVVAPDVLAAPTYAPTKELPLVEEAPVVNRADESARVGYEIAPTLENTRYRDLHDAGVLTELRTADDLNKVSDFQAKYGEDIPENAKAFYSPQQDRAYIFADRLSDADRADPTGLLMHEIGVHYGLERTIGTERYTQLLDSLAASSDPRVKEAIARVPLDTPEHLVLEETLGYLAETNPRLGVVSGTVSAIRNWLRESIPMFRRMVITTNDVLRYVKGSLEYVRKNGRLSNDLTFPYVWHGSPVRGIQSLDLSYAGSGEGNAAFGHGHYLTSEKGTALDYRNKEAARRGIEGKEGGLYRVKINASPDEIMSWDKPISEQPAIMEALRGHMLRDDIENGNPFYGKSADTGSEIYERLTKDFGSQQAASAYLNEVGIKGLKYETGRTRGTDTPSSNYVMFSDQHVDISNRYSTNPTPMAQPQRDDVRLGPLADAFKKQIDTWNEVLPGDTARLRQRAMSWYTITRKLPIYKQFREMFDSVGLKLALSKSKGVRMWASALAEDATGMNRQHATSAAIDKVKLQAGWRTPVIEAMHRLMPQMMTAEEKSIWSQGPLGATVERRIGREVAIERLKHRAAVQAGQTYVSDAPKALREAAGVLDSMFKDIGETGEATGATDAANIKHLGYVGYMPYKWDWAAIHHAYNNEPVRFNTFKSMLREQYTNKVLTPTMDKFLSKGPQLPEAVNELRTATMQKVDHLVDNYISQVMRDPKSRVSGADDHFAVVASQILNENWAGDKVTGQMAQEFRAALKDIIADRKRTEFDLIRPDAQGNMLLDFMDTDIARTVNHNTSKYAGSIALAKKGIVDPLHMTAVKDALRQDGATPKEIDHIDFLYRSLIDDLNNEELPAGNLIQMGAHMSMMGGLGFNAVADAASLAATSGIKGFISTVGGIRMNPDSPLFKQLAEQASSALGMDHRMHMYDTPTSTVKPESILVQGSNLNRLADAGVQMVNTLSGMKHVNQLVHNAYLPVMVEDMLKALKGEGGGLTPARLADTGLHPELAFKIKEQLAKHDAGRNTGERINWDKWDDQSVADDFISAIHRAAGQTLQRAFIGEVPRWASEGSIGRFMGQFKRFGITAAEKQAARNMFIGDANSVSGFAFATAWGAALYWAKTEAKMVGMDDTQRAKYEKENLEGLRLATGIAVMVNMSGLLPDAADLGATLFGGGSHAGGSPVAALGYLQNMGKAVNGVTHAAGSAVGVTDHTDYVKDFKNAWRIVPGGNTIFGTALVNSIASQP